MTFPKHLTALLVLSVTLMTGCTTQSESALIPTPITSQSEGPSPAQEVANPWECEKQQDGLGDELFCNTQTIDSAGAIWTLTLLCTSDGKSLHSIVGIDSGAGDILFPVGPGKAKVRIDSGAIEEWAFDTKAEGRGLYFEGFDAKSVDENTATWELLTKIASAKSLGFKTFDAQNNPQSALFDVQQSVPVAATFSAMGCSS